MRVLSRVRNHDLNRTLFSCTIARFFLNRARFFLNRARFSFDDFHNFIDFSLEHLSFIKFFRVWSFDSTISDISAPKPVEFNSRKAFLFFEFQNFVCTIIFLKIKKTAKYRLEVIPYYRDCLYANKWPTFHGLNSWLRLEVDWSLKRRKIMYIRVHWFAYCQKNIFQLI